MKKIIIQLAPEWVMRQDRSKALPAQAIHDDLEQNFPNNHIKKIVSDFTQIELSVEGIESQEELEKFLTKVFQEVTRVLAINYSADPSAISDICEVRIIENVDEEDEEGEESLEEEEQKEESPEDVLEEIHNMKGAVQFIAFCDRVHKKAEVLKKHKLEPVFMRRCYLFSIEPGAGFSTALNRMCRLFVSEGLANLKGGFEIEMRYDQREELMLSQYEEGLSKVDNALVALDISKWASSLNTPEFRSFLRHLEGMKRNKIYVFKVPYLEKNSLREIQEALSDVFSVETIAFVPQSAAELQELANEEIAEYNYTATDGAWKVFQNRLREEKSDGHFYGIDTAKKIADEMMLLKVRTSGEDLRITERDMKGLTHMKLLDQTPEQQLDALIGMQSIKQQIMEIMQQIRFAKQNSSIKAPSMHMQFLGNPGTGKTTIARIIGEMFKDAGLLSKGYFIEHAGGDFIGQYVGHTAPKTAGICRDAYGSVLFIDEDYAIADNAEMTIDGSLSGFAKEAMDMLIAQMENHRDDMLVIMAGYQDDMKNLLKLNHGLESRIPYTINFPNFTRDELISIFYRMMTNDGFEADESLKEGVEKYFEGLSDEFLKSKEFSNARYVRNLYEKTWSKAILRRDFSSNGDRRILTASDFEQAAETDKKQLNEPGKIKIGFNLQ